MAITGCFRSMSRDKLYSELSHESLVDRQILLKAYRFLQNCQQKGSPIFNYLPTQDLASINLRKRPTIYPLDARTECYHNSFFPYCISQWNNLNSCIRNLPSIATFKHAILDFNALALHQCSR